MRGLVDCEIEGVFADQTEFTYFGSRSTKDVAVLVDETGNMSRPFYVPSGSTPEGLVERLDECTAAEQTFWGKILHNENMVSCSALSRYSLDSSEADRRMTRLIKNSLALDENLLFSRDIFKSRRFRSISSPDKV
jgi:hypothetical protein